MILEDTSPQVKAILAAHNAEALDNLLTYVRSFIASSAGSLPPGNTLPVSGLAYPIQHTADMYNLGACEGAVAKGALQDYQMKVFVASPFVALSGMQLHMQTTADWFRA